ncbi:hypothetical protein TREES_T100020688 [Tupaia chinensis]|uniref:Uncharacterized protein n=1 Tax=Tupaia chinensis TaxID=246437 RepID=L9KLD5_TUPCH|nr:hypothetical protein TREES_T100020688 [Tupaia chinensis]
MAVVRAKCLCRAVLREVPVLAEVRLCQGRAGENDRCEVLKGTGLRGDLADTRCDGGLQAWHSAFPASTPRLCSVPGRANLPDSSHQGLALELQSGQRHVQSDPGLALAAGLREDAGSGDAQQGSQVEVSRWPHSEKDRVRLTPKSGYSGPAGPPRKPRSLDPQGPCSRCLLSLSGTGVLGHSEQNPV